MGGCDDLTRFPVPQWSLTSSVRKRHLPGQPRLRVDGPAMEPDLIGQEKTPKLAAPP